jgi:hypothetical protein
VKLLLVGEDMSMAAEDKVEVISVESCDSRIETSRHRGMAGAFEAFVMHPQMGLLIQGIS